MTSVPEASIPIAIVGMAAAMPAAPDLDTYWRNLRDGIDAITDVPTDRFDPDFHGAAGPGESAADRTHCRRGGFLEAAPTLDAARFGVVPATASAADPDHLIALGVAADAVDDAGGPQRLGNPSRIGVVLGRGGYLGAGMARFNQRVRGIGEVVRAVTTLVPDVDAGALREALHDALPRQEPEAAIGLVPNLVASQIANRLDLRGPAYTVDAACASSLIAVDRAVADLASGRCDTVLAGGVHHCHDATLWSVFTQLGALSPTGRVRPFAHDADGLLVGEGTGIVVLKRFDDARRDGDRIYAVVRGVGTSSDGRTGSLVAPDTAGQVAAVRAAWADAGLDPTVPGALGLLEAHGTATAAGDAAEIRTLREVFGPVRAAGPDVVVGSVKSMIGHTMPAAGIAGLIKVALALHHRTLPPTLHCDVPHPDLAATRFAPIDTARIWAEGAGPRTAAVQAFGFGGVNAHVVLGEAPTVVPLRAAPTVAEPERVLRLAAPTVEALAARLASPDEDLRGAEPPESGAHLGPVRLGVVGPDARTLAAARTVVGRGQRWSGRRDIWFSPEPLLPGASTVFLYPGLEGSFAPRLDDVADRLGAPRVGSVDIADIRAHTRALMETGALLGDALTGMGLRPDTYAGHSVGEWAAMAAAGLIRPGEDDDPGTWWPRDLTLPEVDFVALGCSASRAAALVGDDPLVLSHDNAPRQTVVCGPPWAAAALVRRAGEAGVVASVLPFRSGFHTPAFAPHVAPMRRIAERMSLHPRRAPVWSATTAAPFPPDDAGVRSLYLRHLLEPVRFRPLIEALHDAGHRVFVPVGSGQLGGFVGDCLADRPHLVVSAAAANRGGLDQLRRVAVALWVAGADPAPVPLDAPVPVATGGRGPVAVPIGAELCVPGLSLPAAARDLVGAAVRDRGGVAGLPAAVEAEFSALMAELRTDTAAVRAAVGAPTPAEGPSEVHRERVRVSWETMPELADHCLALRPAGWPDRADRRSVVPGTALVDMARDAAARARPDAPIAAVTDVRFRRWVPGFPAHDIDVVVTPEGPAEVRVDLGGFADARVVLGETTDLDLGTPPTSGTVELTGPSVYGRRLMFHGPRYQAVVAVAGRGDDGIEGVLEVTSGRGALLDGVGQLLGLWLEGRADRDKVAFPLGIDEVRTIGPTPPTGTRLTCRVRATTAATGLRMDAGLWLDDRPWGRIRGWRDVRLHVSPAVWSASRFPDQHLIASPQTGGWVLAADTWPGAASLEFHAGLVLGAPELAAFDALPVAGRRAWLLERIAAKDAVRRHLAALDLAAAEVAVDDTAAGMVVSGHHRELPAVRVAVARDGDVAVGIAADATRGPGPGIALRPPGDGDARVPDDGTGRGPERARTIDHGGRRLVVAWTLPEFDIPHPDTSGGRP